MSIFLDFLVILVISLTAPVLKAVVFQAEDGIRDIVRSRGLGDVYKRQAIYWRVPVNPGICEAVSKRRVHAHAAPAVGWNHVGKRRVEPREAFGGAAVQVGPGDGGTDHHDVGVRPRQTDPAPDHCVGYPIPHGCIFVFCPPRIFGVGLAGRIRVAADLAESAANDTYPGALVL